MDEKSKKELKDGGEHLLHGLEDAATVIGHTAAGVVKGVADGVESASNATQERKADEAEKA